MNPQSNSLKPTLPCFLDNKNFGVPIFPQVKYIIINDAFKKNHSICPICLSIPNQFFRPNSCNHYFCKKCLNHWNHIKSNCPICRIPFNKITKI